MANDLGFGNRKKLDLTGFTPKAPASESNEVEQVTADKTADRLGFQSREPVRRIKRVRKTSEPLDQAFVRAPIEVINRFKTYCNQTGMSYGEALDELMRQAGL